MKKNLIIGVLTYFVVLTYFFGTASGWNGSAFVKLINPLLVIYILVFACLSMLPTLLLPIRLRRTLLFVSAGLATVGVLLILIHRIQPEISTLAGYDVVNFGAAAIGIGIAFLGLDIARESDDKMKAIANLQFDDKVVAMEDYMDGFSDKSFDSKLLEPEYKKFIWNLRAMAHVARWADKERRREARVKLNAIISHLEGKMDTKRLDEVKSLCNEIWPEMTEAKAMDKIIEHKKTKPSIDIIYEMVKDQHTLISAWSDSLDNKVIGLFGLTTLILGAVTALNKAYFASPILKEGHVTLDWSLAPLVIAALSFIISSIFCLKTFQTKGYSLGVDPRILLEDYASFTPDESKHWLVKFDGEHWEQNLKALNEKASSLRIAIIAATVEIIALVAWIIVV